MISANNTVFLYSVVYSSRCVAAVVIVLVFSFVLQPLDQAYASEESDAEVEIAEEVAEEEELPSEPESKPVESELEVEVVTQSVEEEIVETDSEQNVSLDVQTIEDIKDDTRDERERVQKVSSEELETEVEIGEFLDSVDEDVVVTASAHSESSTDPPHVATVAEHQDFSMVASSTGDIAGVSTTSGSETLIAANPSVASGTDATRESDATAHTAAIASSTSGIDAASATSAADYATSSQTKSDDDTDPAQEDQTSLEDTALVTEREPQVKGDFTDTKSDQTATTSSGAQSSAASSTAATSTPTADSSGEAESSVPVLTQAVSINDMNRHQFSVDECVSVGGGAFYCAEAEAAPVFEDDGVFAEPDADGDKEIFVRVAGDERQITDNLVDDAAPFYDGVSNRIVWQRLVNDRYQIVSYDLAHGEEIVLTNTSYNNMEPAAYDDVTVWQAWVMNNWEIMVFDGQEVTQITDNATHDVAPSISDEYIVWQTQFQEGWKVAVYTISTGHIKYVDNEAAAGLVENPRFVLVFDSIDENGDTRTLGYDFRSGTTIQLGSLPAELPDGLPEPESTGEERALVQVKPSVREGKDDENTDGISGSEPLTTTTKASATTTVSDLVILDMGEQSTTTDPVNNSLSGVPEAVAAPASSTDHIPDLVIPPTATTTATISG